MKKTAGSAALQVKWSYKAIRQLAEIFEYIDQYNSGASVSLRRKAGAAAQKLSSIPYGYRSGRVPGTREMVIHPNYLLVYRVNGGIQILRVLHARKKYPRTHSL
ncbi:type II toxin-antitoxin system RelE/ParE family toxin [Pseudomonas sp. HN2]|uniref:type II toxin-antitoxin system RelE/ParE family toxin n=1 Tax=Pseudomonas TaxID=286 RepID=UPI001D154151|nr:MULTISPECIES: type II toxin-antitoxin system RelE/ParE family toxin [Pseudomonas]UEB93671.1 type II toxin-antitoxin system RelE/ParE family toxin [Pseudomonas sp. HN2]UST67099.1 type II toxin-antitoxin system RelE/ParE family toxin [Pseudomonas moraviensis]